MPQSTNLNKNPYYDDFNESKNFYKVLFKPGVTVQTRELTTLQSILQNQVEKLGDSFFKKNSVVVPGGFAYDSSYYAVEVESTFKGISVEDYFKNLIGTTVTGKTSNITAKIENVLSKSDSERNNTTFYIKYQSSSSSNFTENTFVNGEELVLNSNISFENGQLLSGSSIAKTISPVNRLCTSVGYSAKIDDGIYFVRGFFVNVTNQVLILDQYSNTPSYRVGLNINEEIIDVSQDSTLYDNAQGFSNYAAPGADRLKISLTLIKKSLDDFRDENFIELFRVSSGIVTQIKNSTDSSYITEILARRTFDESGNYYVSPFNVECLESLNDNLGNGGLYSKGDVTVNNIIPSDDNGIIKISPGKAYIKGYEVPTNTEILNFPKPRTTKHVESSSSFFYAGNLLRVNNLKNIPNIGLTTNYTIDLYKRRLVSGSTVGTPIGVARVYDFSSHINSYRNPSSQFNLNLFDIQTYSEIISDSSLSSISVGDYIKGNNSGSVGFVQGLSGQTITLRQVSGTFIPNESVIVNGIQSTISIGTFTNYSLEDVKSLSNNTFTADTVLSKLIPLNGPFTLKAEPGIGTITSDNGSAFASNLKVSDIVKYSQSGVGSDVYARITNISTLKNSITLGTVDTVSNVCSGNLGVSTSLQNIFAIRPEVFQIDDSSLTSKLNNSNIENVDFLNSNIYVKVSYSGVSKSSTTLTLPSLSGTDYVYSAYNSGRYVVVNADGSIENLDSSTLTITSGGKQAQFTGLSATSGPCRVITTQIKSNVSQKYKKLNRCNSLTISKSKYSIPPNAGLAYTSIYGTRVEDDQISLNVPDVLNVHGVFESSTTSDPSLTWITISGLNSPNSSSDDLVVGELIIGQSSGAVALYALKKDTSQVYLIQKNDKSFSVGEIVSFSESGYTASISYINLGDKNIVDEFVLDDGQRSHFYDFSRLVRKNGTKDPAGRLTIFFDRFTYETNDYGDVTAVNSYPSTLSKNLIPSFNGTKNTDIIDIRPRVSNYNTLSTVSPFDFSSRNFNSSFNNPTQILSPYENFIFDYDFYLPRVDKLTLSKNGTFEIVFGEPDESPKDPFISDEVLDIATIVSSPYVYDVKEDVSIIISDHRRYTMSDIKDIDNRVSNLEYYTSLSLLELSTQNLLITDSNGLNRFKSGFFVDEFNNYDTSDTDNLSYNALIEDKTLSSTKREERIDLSLFSTDDYTAISDINLANTTCSNLKITGNKLSLDYSELSAISQPFASKSVNVNPFNIVTWSGLLELTPPRDTWQVPVKGKKSKKYITTRNINFTGVNLKPTTRFKLLFDKKDLTSNSLNSTVFPKFLEISNSSGSFIIGETVTCLNSKGKVSCRFRVCSPNHKSGPIDSPTLVFSKNPYNPSIGISTQYGPQSTFLNIDTLTLSRNEVKEFGGKILKGNKLVGTTSKANAIVSDVKLISSDDGVLMGSIWINQKDKFTVGQSSVELVLNTPTEKIEGEISDSSAVDVFTTEGTKTGVPKIEYYYPLSQTFLVEDENGIIPTSVDVYFQSKDPNVPITLQIREVSSGVPGGPDKVISGLSKTLSSSQVIVSSDASNSTKFTFSDMVRLPAGEYAITLVSDSNEYKVWVSEIGSVDISTVNLPTVNKIFINRQPYLGTLFKCQNAQIWTPSPLEDLKFTLNKAKFVTSGGTARFYNATDSIESSENTLPENPITTISGSGYPNDGRHILVLHPNHGMYSSNDKVQIAGVESDILPQTLTISYGTTETGPISVASTTIFSTFEGSAVSPTNPGYIKISNEIIKYESIGTGQLLNITRGVSGTIPSSHNVNDFVYKYEFNNVSLNRINTEFTIVSDPKPTLDTYYVQVSSGSTFTQTKSGGGDSVRATKNKQFSELSFNSGFITKFNNTQVSSSVRTISSKSVDGNEVSFVDGGFQTVGIDSVNKFDAPRMVASRVNELNYLNSTNFVGNRSFTFQLELNTDDSNVSPLIDLTENYAIGKIYNINQPVGLSSYASDNRVNSDINDPHGFIQVTKRVNLEQSANSLQVLFSSYRNSSSDIRVLYKIFTNDVPDDQQIWNLFPGYNNLDVNGNIVNSANNDGRPDKNVRSSLNNEYLDYSFTIDNLPSFTGYQIKIVGTSTNQSYSPLIKELRTIALK